ncbi:MAG: hypothetical protein KJZ84_07145 [Bryobacteraceae bacterium]|nr:hypothetical protein [Bryobacteraceae bacterium]
MTCRHCGARIGILERWRYGEFCSREHKDEFALENEKLTEEILRDLRRPLGPAGPVSIAKHAAAHAPEPEAAPEFEEPDPPMAEEVPQAEPSALRAAPLVKAEETPKAKPGWKEFASLANLDRPAAVGVIKATTPAHRQLWVEDAEPPADGPYARVRRRSLGLPFTQYRRRRPGLRMLEQLLSIDPPVDTPPPAVATEAEFWGGWPAEAEAGWDTGWDAAVSMAPGIGVILDDYPLTAPWDRWERWPVAAPAPLPGGLQDRRHGVSVAPQGGPGHFASPPGRPGSSGGPGNMAVPSAPGFGTPRPAGLPAGASSGLLSGAAPAGPGVFAAGPTLPGLSLPGFASPAISGHPGMLRGRGPAGGYSAVWREMAPPMFLAQADPATDLGPLNRPQPACPMPAGFVHSRPRVFRPRTQLLPPPARVPAAPLRRPVALRLADVWTPSPAEPARWRP